MGKLAAAFNAALPLNTARLRIEIEDEPAKVDSLESWIGYRQNRNPAG
jgi:hypothetical protein